MTSKRFPIVVSLVAAAVLMAAPATAIIKSEDVSGHEMTQYFDLSYATQSCDGHVYYDLRYTAVRWYRQSTSRRLGDARLRMGQSTVFNCAGSNTSNFLERDVNPRFEGDALWTVTYTTSVEWGWGRPIGFDIAIGANQRLNVKNASGTYLGHLCSTTYVIGNGDCT